MYLKPLIPYEELKQGYSTAFSWTMQYVLAIDEQGRELKTQNISKMNDDEKRWYIFRTESLAIQLANIETLLHIFVGNVYEEDMKLFIEDAIERCKIAREMILNRNNEQKIPH